MSVMTDVILTEQGDSMNTISLELRRKLHALEHNERYMYFKGETGQMPPMIARTVMDAVDAGLVTVVHRKVQDGHFGVYEYWAVGL